MFLKGEAVGNPAHLEELLKGVAHWNAWRAAQGEDFVPDFASADIRKAFVDAYITKKEDRLPLGGSNLRAAEFSWADLRWANLVGADLREANLRGANLRGADIKHAQLQGAILDGADLVRANISHANIRRGSLRETNLMEANLEGSDLGSANLVAANLRETNLTGASLGGSNLERANLRGAYLEAARVNEAKVTGANLSTIRPSPGVTTRDGVYRTDLSGARHLTQSQLSSMQGDSATIIPKQLATPSHWGGFKFSEPESELEGPSTKQQLTQHIELLLTTLPAASASANDLAARLRVAGQIFDTEMGVNGSDESRMLDQVAAAFASLGAKLKEFEGKTDRDELIEELRREIDEKESQIAELTTALCAQPSAARQILIGALIGAGGVGLVNGAGYLLGPAGAEVVQGLWNLLTGGGTAPPPLPPSIPPTTTP